MLHEQPPAVRVIEHVTLEDPLRRLDASGWQRIGHRCYALLSFGMSFVDTTLVPLSEFAMVSHNACAQSWRVGSP